jgi:hypothetical protein
MTLVLPRLNAKTSLRAVNVALNIIRGSSRRRSGTGPGLSTWHGPDLISRSTIQPNYSVNGISSWQLLETAAGTKQTLVHPHKPPQLQDSRGCSLTCSAQGGPRAAGIITAGISVRYRYAGRLVPVPRAFPRRAAVVGHRGLARDGLVRFVLRSHPQARGQSINLFVSASIPSPVEIDTPAEFVLLMAHGRPRPAWPPARMGLALAFPKWPKVATVVGVSITVDYSVYIGTSAGT